MPKLSLRRCQSLPSRFPPALNEIAPKHLLLRYHPQQFAQKTDYHKLAEHLNIAPFVKTTFVFAAAKPIVLITTVEFESPYCSVKLLKHQRRNKQRRENRFSFPAKLACMICSVAMKNLSSTSSDSGSILAYLRWYMETY
jgi:hypothetical protein